MKEITFLVFGNNQHICTNYTNEALKFFDEKPYGLIYYKFMAIYPFINVLLSIVALGLYCHTMRIKCGKRTKGLFYLLINLCLWDLLFQLTMGINQLMIYRMESGLFVATSEAAIRIYISVLVGSIVAVTWCHISRNLSILLIAVMRYEMVCKSSERRKDTSFYHMKKKLLYIIILPLIISIPRCFEFSFHICLPKLQLLYIRPLLLQNPLYFWLYSGLFLCVSQSIIPAVILLIITIKLVKTICSHNRVRKINFNRPPISTKQMLLCRPDILIVLLCTMFWLCELPGTLKMVDIMSDKLHELGWFMNLMPCIDSTFNFVVYIIAHYLGTFSQLGNSNQARMYPLSSVLKLDSSHLLPKKKVKRNNSI